MRYKHLDKKRRKRKSSFYLFVIVVILFFSYGVYRFFIPHGDNKQVSSIGKFAEKPAANEASATNTETKKEVDAVKAEPQQKAEDKKDNSNTTKNEQSAPSSETKKLTHDAAVEIVRKSALKTYPNVKYTYDHDQSRDGKNYYVIHVYEDMSDHSATLGWYYVEVETGKAFEWDLIEDKLMPIN